MILYHSFTNGLLCNFVCVCPSACLWVHEYKCRCLQRPEDRISSSSTEVTSSCELSNSSAGNWILVLDWSSTTAPFPQPNALLLKSVDVSLGCFHRLWTVSLPCFLGRQKNWKWQKLLEANWTFPRKRYVLLVCWKKVGWAAWLCSLPKVAFSLLVPLYTLMVHFYLSGIGTSNVILWCHTFLKWVYSWLPDIIDALFSGVLVTILFSW